MIVCPFSGAGKPPKPEFEDQFLVSGFTHPLLPVVSAGGTDLQHWGLIPYWVKDESSAKEIRAKTLNAAGETVFENLLSDRAYTAEGECCRSPVFTNGGMCKR
jgi:hypothetical protein